MSKVKARIGEIHPFLTKIETLFFPLKNRINRLEYLWGFAKGLGCIFAISALVTLLKLGLVKIFPDMPISLFSSWTITAASWLFFFMIVRGDYYRLQDFNFSGNIAYYFAALAIIAQYALPTWNTVKLESELSAGKIAFFANVAISTMYCLIVFLMPGTKHENKYGHPS